MFRVVIIGIGAIAAHFARGLSEISNAKLVAASCRGEAKGKEFAAKWGCAWFSDNERMLNETKPDVAIICTPSAAHLEPTLAATSRKIHVLCEKPLEVSIARVRQMMDAAE